jgi:hypothetical protein
LAEVQASVFQGSFVGPIIKNNLSVLLINAIPLSKLKHGDYRN